MKRILVIEDDAEIRNGISDLLQAEKFEVLTAADGLAGLQLAQAHIPDLILCDVLMPELDGFGVLQALRDSPATATVPFIFLTARASRRDLRQGMLLGADDYIFKPFTIEELLGAIATRLEKQATLEKFYSHAVAVPSPAQQQVVDRLSLALERSEFQLYYQPQINLQTQTIIGAESLLRWHHPERGVVLPSEFIPLAEQTGLIIPLGEWVLATACQQLKIWQTSGFADLKIAVNLSAQQFNQPNLRRTIANVLANTGLDPKGLELELTESTLVQDAHSAATIMHEFRTLGVKISIDDFGTGYSSLNYLQHFPIDTLKIDRSFIHNITKNSKNAAIATAIIEMAHGLNMTAIAEGVETLAELQFLNQHKCNIAQGFWFSRPIPTTAFTELLQRHQFIKC